MKKKGQIQVTFVKIIPIAKLQYKIFMCFFFKQTTKTRGTFIENEEHYDIDLGGGGGGALRDAH